MTTRSTQTGTRKRPVGKATSKPTGRAPAKAPGKTVAKIDKLPGDMTQAAAKRVTEKIKAGVTNIIQLLLDAAEGRAWKALGYKNWQDYINVELGGAPLQLPTLKRREAVEAFVKNGWSTRQIAAATDTPQSTISDDVAAIAKASTDRNPVSSNGQGDLEPMLDEEGNEIPTVEGELVDEEPRTVTGLDGKDRTVTPRSPVVVNILSEAKNIAKQLDAVRIKLDALFDRDEYEDDEVKVTVDQALQQAIDDFSDTVGPRLPERVSA